MRPLVRSLCLVALSATACIDAGSKSYGDPTSLQQPSESAGIVAWVEKPEQRAVGSAAVDVVIGAHTQGTPEPLTVTLGKLERDETGSYQTVAVQEATVSGEPGTGQRFTIPVALSHGLNELVARIQNADQTKVRTLSFSLTYEGAAPGLTFGARAASEPDVDPCSQGRELSVPITSRGEVCAWGHVTTGNGAVSSAILSVGGASQDVTLSADGSFAVKVALPPDQASVLALDVRDQAGGQTRAKLSLVSDQTPPKITLTTSASETSQPSIDVTGSAEDSYGIAQIEVRGLSGSRRQLGKASPFSTNVQLVLGANDLKVVARDVAGNEAEASMSVARVRVLRLGTPKRDVGTTRIEMTRQDLRELLTEEDQRTIEMVAIDLAPSVKSTLQRIRNPEQYGVSTDGWGPAEFNMQRILRMTPDVADLSGTSMAKLLEISAAVGLPPARMLSDLLNLAPTDYILDLNIATDVIVELMLGSHPNIARDGAGKPVLAVSMYDVLQDLTSIAPRFGPAGGHPGFLSGTSMSKVMESGFLLTLPVHSNLVQYDAIDLSRSAKDYLFLLEGERVLDFNVLTDEFEVVGLADEPTIDLRFTMKEGPAFATVGSDRNAAPDPAAPGFFRGNGAAFSYAPYLFEHIASEIGYRQLRSSFEAENFQRTLRYDAGSINNAAVIDWNRGWVNIQTAGNLGSPPAPQYVWDTLCEVAQARLHDQGVAEGAADMAFSIQGLPIGLTADELIEKLRPKLHEQEDKLSELLAGDTGLAQSRADLYFAPGSGGEGALLFRNPDDGGGGVSYEKPGFYADSALTNKVSSLAPAFGVADDKHEKVSAAAGGVFYAQDADGSSYEIRILNNLGDTVELEVRKAGGAP